MTAEFIPDAGDIIWLSLVSQRGREQSGRRPFLVLSPRDYNAKTSLAVGVPVTSKQKGYPFEVALPPEGRIAGAALADRVKNLDWRARVAEHAQDASPATLREVRALIAALLAIS